MLENRCALVHLRSSKPPKLGMRLLLGNHVGAVVKGRRDELTEIQFEGTTPIVDILHDIGQMPLPPYFHRPAEESDTLRYQTVYAKHDGAVAAPTAGLHFDVATLDAIQERGIEIAFLTLHVGAGTFQPVRAEKVEDHKMHSEYLEVSEELCAKVIATKQRGGKVIAVGTTSARGLECASQKGQICPYRVIRIFLFIPVINFSVWMHW